jgi:hypothetical protein
VINTIPKEALSVTRKHFHAPNSRANVIANWRNEGRLRAIGSLTYYGGIISGKHLAAIIGVSPRGLRQMLRGDKIFMPEIRESEDGRGETWYRLNVAALPTPQPPPRLISAPEVARNCVAVTRRQTVK